jgi:hypothetical protein
MKNHKSVSEADFSFIQMFIILMKRGRCERSARDHQEVLGEFSFSDWESCHD